MLTCNDVEHLEHINLRGCKIDDECIPVLTEFCPRLHTVVIEACSLITNTGVGNNIPLTTLCSVATGFVTGVVGTGFRIARKLPSTSPPEFVLVPCK